MIILRIFILLALGAGALFWGWEFGLAGTIFVLSLRPKSYELLFLGLGLDGLLLFPFAFFTVTIFLQILASGFLARFFERENLASLFVRILFLLLGTIFFAGLYFLPDFFQDLSQLLKFLLLLAARTLPLLLVLAAGFKIFEKTYVASLP